MKKIAKFGILALLLVSLVGSAFAFPGIMKDKRVRAALEDKDYEAWVDAVTATLTKERFEKAVAHYNRMSKKQAMMDEICETGVIPEDIPKQKAEWLEENLDAACEFHEARQNGMDKEELRELAEELGIKFLGKGNFKGKHSMEE